MRAIADHLTSLRREIEALGATVHSIDARAQALQAELNARHAEQRNEHHRTMLGIRIARDDDAGTWDRLWRLRQDPEYELAYSETDPLVTIIITTYHRPELLRDRAIPSVLAQTYRNLECLVVGDAAAPETAEVVASFADPRLRFVNLSSRGPYPERYEDAWLVWGGTPYNTALRLGRGRWFGFVSDDDALVPTHTASLLRLARSARAELAYGQLRFRHPDAPDEIKGTPAPPQYATWGLQSSLFHAGLSFLPLMTSDWVFSVPIDWSWMERLLRAGVRLASLPEPVVDYFPSRSWNDRPSPR